MRAKFINEAKDFERGRDPKQAMGIGGFDAQEVFENTYERGLQEWKDFMDKFVGKKVNFVVANDHDNTDNAKVHDKRITIDVHSYGMHFQHPDHIWFFALPAPVSRYMIDIDEKIYIEK